MRKNRETEGRPLGNEAAPDDLGNDRRCENESVEELEETDQALEAATVKGLEDAADHRERTCSHPHGIRPS